MEKNLVLFSFLISFSTSLCASNNESYYQVSRYLESKMVAAPSQLNPLDSVIRIKFPMTIITVKDAIDYVLDDSGYEIVHEQFRTEEMSLILSAKIAHTQRDLSDSPLTILDVINLVVGDPFYVVRDPLRRKVSVILKDEYRGLIDG
ncbi:hypothetical protein [Pseudoalteromonas sp. SR41-6]|uniref:hypothetical protein n=1 Tax=Pseudoalteromonas sp. SR41-6 TaxID=2760948 RepID=UPI0016001A56|nr:hypothetical protein [Pseudoalteromonas sp. SR41-6]MBB1333914.1 hypothetical protein [Pseudoalteromonas sp. SR41-6]